MDGFLELAAGWLPPAALDELQRVNVADPTRIHPEINKWYLPLWQHALELVLINAVCVPLALSEYRVSRQRSPPLRHPHDPPASLAPPSGGRRHRQRC